MNDKKSMFPKIVGLSGYAKSGKSTVAEFLVNEYFYSRIRFAEGLKSMLHVIGLTNEQIDGTEKEVSSSLLCGQTPRYAMQTLGTEWGRKIIGNDIWVNIWEQIVNTELSKNKHVVVDDIRFINELDRVKSMGGLIIRIERNGYGPLNNHSSETSLVNVKFDNIILNDGSKEDLYKKVSEILYKNIDLTV